MLRVSLLSIAFILLVQGASQAQTNTIGEFNRHMIEKWSGEAIRIGQYRVKGSPYLLGESFPGYVKYANDASVSGVNILYDIFYQKVGLDKDNQMVTADAEVKEFSITLPRKYGGEKLLFRNGSLYGEASGKHYYNVLEDGQNATLLKLFRNRTIPDPTNQYAKEMRVFEQFYEYYIYDVKSKSLKKIKLKQKDVLNKLNDTGKLQAFAEEFHLDFTDEKDIARLVAYYNTAVPASSR